MTWDVAPYFHSNRLRKLEIDIIEYVDVRPVNHGVIAVAQLESNGVSKVSLLVRNERVEKQLSVSKVFFEFIPACPLFYSFETLRIPDISSVYR